MKRNRLFFCFILLRFFSCATNYYINDGTYNGDDLFTTAVGNNTNNGTAASTPKLTFANLWSTYGPAGTNVITDGDIIYVDAGTFTSASAVVGTCNCGFTINSDITIQGAGNKKTIFDNNYVGIAGTYYFANITASASIKDIQFRKYASNQNGQAIQISATGAPGVTLENVITNLNGGSSRYASIYIGSNSTVTITGGGQNCNGDAAHNASGGIDILGTGITVNISNTAFIGNYKSSSAAIGHGAALSITGADGTTDVNISNCLFSGNHTDNDAASGSTIYATSGDLVLTDCTIEYGDTYESGVKYGGATYFTGGTQLFTRVLVQNNTNTGGSTYGTVSVHGGALTLTNCYFSGNTSDRGKDIYCKSGTITATNTTFGSAVNQIATYGGTITITNCGTPTNVTSTGTFTDNGGAAPAFTTPIVPTFTGTCAGVNVVLPIELLYFDAEKKADGVDVFWSTSSERNNDYFILEKSIDGILWDEISRKKGHENSYIENHYSFFDNGVKSEIVYYKLSQVDLNGEIAKFDPISVRFLNDERSFYYLNMLGQKVDFEIAPFGVYLKIHENGTMIKIVKE